MRSVNRASSVPVADRAGECGESVIPEGAANPVSLGGGPTALRVACLHDDVVVAETLVLEEPHRRPRLSHALMDRDDRPAAEGHAT